MADSKAKYKEYRDAIEKVIEGKKGATISLKADRAGDEIKISANADAPGAKADAKLMLRLVLVEEVVRYRGGNKLRFHHHVVRSFPGGVKGKGLTEGKGEASATVDLAGLRKDLEKYLADFAKENGSFASQPPIDLTRLSVVAFVQDDADRSVLNAVLVPVAEPKP